MNNGILDRLRKRMKKAGDARRHANLPSPSFYNKLVTRKRLADRVRYLRGAGDEPIYEMETKLGQKDVARRAGVKVADIIQGPFNRIGDFDLDALPQRFVVKPEIGSGANGVHILEKRADALVDLRTGKTHPRDLAELGLEPFLTPPNAVFVEEIVEFRGAPARDFKVFSFFGEIGFVFQPKVGSKPIQYRTYSADGTELGKIFDSGHSYNPALAGPNDLVALIEAARKVSRSIPTPFCRVDLYESDKGVLLGEITLRPGSVWKSSQLHRFVPDWDRKLGELWEDAEARLVDTVGEVYLP